MRRNSASTRCRTRLRSNVSSSFVPSSRAVNSSASTYSSTSTRPMPRSGRTTDSAPATAGVQPATMPTPPSRRRPRARRPASAGEHRLRLVVERVPRHRGRRAQAPCRRVPASGSATRAPALPARRRSHRGAVAHVHAAARPRPRRRKSRSPAAGRPGASMVKHAATTRPPRRDHVARRRDERSRESGPPNSPPPPGSPAARARRARGRRGARTRL